MPMILELIIDVCNWWNGVNKIKANLKQKSPDAIKLGVLSAAGINFPAIFDPVQTHPGVVITAIAARSKAKAEAQVAKYKLDAAKVYDSYEEVLQDPDIEAVYIPLPNGLHHKWAINAMRAGKHVLIEKPITSNADEAKEIRDCANETGKIALEAYHWRFHPAAHRVKEIVESGKYGHLTSVFSKMVLPPGTLSSDDIRFKYELGGGASMDLCYVLSSSLYWAAAPNDVKGTSFEVLSTKPQLSKRDKRVDENMDATITITNADSARSPVKCTTVCQLATPKYLGFIPQMWGLTPLAVLELEQAKIEFTSFSTPFIGHKIIVTEKSGKKTTETCYTGGPIWGERGQSWWTTYRYQLEGFVDRIKATKNQEKYNGPWVDLDESVKLMEIVDAVYEKSGMPKRGAK
ncbi:uncharacterized protein TRIVIDRAFT_65506 [Trichoderma virens Gv29-8]|uniref:D-xylose 1-dehydrogenase (NADP(+), D-xylono-1,5-lactone-forming) n=1 Tax=Hypocrea virens (strain Gv29-8 / FGSC 10586) TaxID=413071 RepID=G9N9X7_HYPVG|nr:uncharacterized protein TRIVIDRAFT_65506 [Trichoderma virens Gv29-8]EHK16745.1 hypothetical protein TRIVIDRAFT_65506 [Trichoderma virens Gv29-8]UKZ51877.1 hypothetical protein TrVGV298_005642 [Trichoderma virens]